MSLIAKTGDLDAEALELASELATCIEHGHDMITCFDRDEAKPLILAAFDRVTARTVADCANAAAMTEASTVTLAAIRGVTTAPTLMKALGEGNNVPR